MHGDLLYDVQNTNGMSHFRIGTHYCNLPEIGESERVVELVEDETKNQRIITSLKKVSSDRSSSF